jgi:23S rRNA (guanosine2251-2'-O)-methyltransferase
MTDEVIYGINPVLEALRAGTVRSVHVAGRADGRVRQVLQRAASAGVAVHHLDVPALTAMAGTSRHQGIVAAVELRSGPWTLDAVLATSEVPLLVVLDGVEDPQNVGAILRTADAAGVTAIVRQERHAAALGGAAARASAGALAHARIVNVVNVARTLVELKTRGIWTVGLDAEGTTDYDVMDYRPPSAVVLGSEGAGLRRLVREQCDFLVRIPMLGRVASLNVSTAAAVVLYEAIRQRRRFVSPR